MTTQPYILEKKTEKENIRDYKSKPLSIKKTKGTKVFKDSTSMNILQYILLFENCIEIVFTFHNDSYTLKHHIFDLKGFNIRNKRMGYISTCYCPGTLSILNRCDTISATATNIERTYCEQCTK